MVGAGTRGENSPYPHPEEQTRLGLRLEGRGWRWPRWAACWGPLVLRDAMRSRMAPQDEGFVLFVVDNIPISAILRSLFTQEGTLPERSVAGWGGGACAVEHLSALPGGLLKAAGRGAKPRCARRGGGKKKKKKKKKKERREAVSLPALDYAGAVSESALRRDGEGRSPMDPLRVTGSVGRGVKSSRLCGRWDFVRAGKQGQPWGRAG